LFVFAEFPLRFVLWPDRATWGRGRIAVVKGRGRDGEKREKKMEKWKCRRQICSVGRK
jgi:hypothetical protein